MERTVLIIDEDRGSWASLWPGLRERGSAVALHRRLDEALHALAAQPFDAIVIALPAHDGGDAIDRLRAIRPDVPVLAIASDAEVGTLTALEAGAVDLVAKPIALDDLAAALERALSREGAASLRLLATAAVPEGALSLLDGESAPMAALRRELRRIGPSELPVLLSGETGSGKELVARTLHRLSDRRERPFVGVNCAAIPERLLESELFGHARGAFTDANADRTGLLVDAAGGTVFLDEIVSMPLELQPKLLRALEARAVRPVGSDHELAFDARIVTAANRDLVEAVRAGDFRSDLLFRIEVLRIDLPPLRERGEDVLLLAGRFIERAATRTGRRVRGLSAAAAEVLLAYRFPGNVRELENCMESAVALADGRRIEVADLPPAIRRRAGGPHPQLGTLEELERRHVARVLRAVGGNRAAAARVLGIARKTLYRKLDRHELA